MTKIDSLRDLLLRAVPSLRANPETLSIFVDRGRVAARAGASLSFEYRYTANLVAQDFSGSPDEIIVPVLAWIARHQPELMAKPNGEPIAFEAELLDADTSDLSLTIELSERVKVEVLPNGDRSITHISDDADTFDRFDGLCGVNLWQLYLNNELSAESASQPQA
ncbi:phage tail protein [Sphingomonas phyllosphaerae]|uniref:phage tail protein n=1 Tax=Sphingomonas phyllosphaerae TaxID=257003 RepID=UPI00040A73B9|nr:phage tail protein [Sphingomonas phyllosphaerae]